MNIKKKKNYYPTAQRKPLVELWFGFFKSF